MNVGQLILALQKFPAQLPVVGFVPIISIDDDELGAGEFQTDFSCLYEVTEVYLDGPRIVIESDGMIR